jgi:prolyl 4-hydroxylase
VTPLITIKVPDAVVYGNFLSSAECAELIAYAEGHMQFSKVVDRTSGKPVLHEARTSSSMFLKRGQTDLVTSIEQRISDLVGLPVENGEGLQVLRYDVGQEYRKHYDYFNPDRETTPHHIKRGGQRIATFLMYLNTPDGGGETTFPHAGISVCANEGNALLFRYDTPTPATKTLHCGEPVTSGVKWVATKWIRQSKFA